VEADGATSIHPPANQLSNYLKSNEQIASFLIEIMCKMKIKTGFFNTFACFLFEKQILWNN